MGDDRSTGDVLYSRIGQAWKQGRRTRGKLKFLAGWREGEGVQGRGGGERRRDKANGAGLFLKRLFELLDPGGQVVEALQDAGA